MRTSALFPTKTTVLGRLPCLKHHGTAISCLVPHGRSMTRFSGIVRIATIRGPSGGGRTNSITAMTIARMEGQVKTCDNCRQPTEATPNLNGEVLCSDQCQNEYGITNLLSLMRYPPDPRLDNKGVQGCSPARSLLASSEAAKLP